MSRHESRQEIARAFGASDVVAERGEEGEAIIAELTQGVGADAVLECVGTDGAMKTAPPEIWDVAVIGGGPSGMMAAGRAAGRTSG